MEQPKPPRGLKTAGKAAWRLCWDVAGEWLTDSDRPLVERLAQLTDELTTYRAALLEHGAVVEEPVVTPRGDVVGTKLAPNPAAKMIHDAGVELGALAKALGLSPETRARLGIVAAKPARRRAAGPEAAANAG